MNKSGSVLAVVLWIMAILAVFSVSIGTRAAAAVRIARDAKDALRLSCGIYSRINEEILRLYQEKDKGAYLLPEASRELEEADEESKVGIGSGDQLAGFLVEELFLHAGLADDEARALAQTVGDWTDADTVESRTLEKEDPFLKNAPLAEAYEMKVILEYYYRKKSGAGFAEKADALYRKIAKNFSVYETKGININTASLDVLKIYFAALLKSRGLNDQVGASATLAQKIIDCRKENKFGSADPAAIASAISESSFLTSAEAAALAQLTGLMKVDSQIFRIRCSGTLGRVNLSVGTVYDRSEHSLKGLFYNR